MPEAVALSFGDIPVAGFVALGLLIAGAVFLIAVPLMVLLIAWRIRNTRPYLWVKERFLLVQRRWPALYIVLTLAMSGLLLVFFTEIAWKTLFRRQMDMFDNFFIWLVRYFANPELDRVMIATSELGHGYFFWASILAMLGTLVFYRRWLEAKGMLVCISGASLLNVMFKLLFERSRPELFRVVEAGGYSFPSGHAMVSVCVYGMIAFLIARHIHHWLWRVSIGAVTMALIAAIGISRIYVGVHYPTDVVAGYAAGAMWLTFCISLLMWRELGQQAEPAK